MMDETFGLSILNPDVLENADALREQFRSAAPFPHVVIDHFLASSFASELMSAFPRFEQGNDISADGRPGGKSTLDRIRGLGPVWQRLDNAIKSSEFLACMGRLTGIEALLYDPWYLGGGTHENRNGMSLDAHVDFNFHPSERWHRRLNLIVYLNPHWQEAWGGCLQLFADPHAQVRPDRSISPAFNRCVIFETSERSWHGFDEIRLPEDHAHLTRRSVALYFYSKHRPATEIADRHTTVYVDRPLPEHLVEGHTLARDEVRMIRQLLARRDDHIRTLYEENTLLRKAQDAGLSGHLLYLAKRAYVRFRR